MPISLEQLTSAGCSKEEYQLPSRNGSYVCESCMVCQPGEKVQRNCSVTQNTRCEPCPVSTFSRRTNARMCKQCRLCPDSSVETRQCTPKQNARCKTCRDGTFYSSTVRRCLSCTDCPPGTFVDKQCGKESDAVCSRCPSGTYSDVYNIFPFCKICQHCRRYEEIVQICNVTQNNICGDCRLGKSH